MSAKSRRRWPIVGAVLALAAVALAAAAAVGALGHWLIVADPLDKAPAIAVLSGGMPFRAMEAAALHADGWAPEVWLTRVRRAANDDAFERLGIRRITEYEYDREVLVRLGVPVEAVRVLDGEVVNTVDEVRVIAAELARRDSTRIILVTSGYHTRRARATWRALVGDAPRAIVRPTREDPYAPERWWRTTDDALRVSREVFGLLNVWAGFPMQPRR